MASAMRAAGNKEGKGGKVATTTTTAVAATAIATGTDSNQMKAAADKKSDYIRCDPTPAYYC
jgi:hypothetical protein